ncbi:MAG: tripartite tricarboxylate transporter TctB family protein [Usitatibacter sp.]
MNEAATRRDLPGIAGSAVFFVMGALALWYSRDFSALGSVFPRTIAVTMMVLSAAYIAVALLRPGAAAPAPAASTWRRVALMVVLLAWAMLLEHVGFLATSIVAYAAILVIANYDRWTPRMALTYVAAGAGVLGSLYSIFRFVLQVPLPAGMLL